MLIKPLCRILAALALLPFASYGLERIDLLPEEAPIYVRVSNITNGMEMLKKSSLGKLWADEQFQDFLGHPMKDGWEALLAEDDMTENDQLMIEQLKMNKGELILAFDTDFEDPFTIVALSREDFLRSLEMDDRMAESEIDPFTIVKDSFQGVDVIQHIYDPGTPDENIYWQAQLNNTLVMGPSQEWVEKSILKLKQEEIEEPVGNPFISVDVPIAQLLREELLGDDTEPEAPAILEAMGLMDVRKLALRVELKDSEIVADNILYTDRLDRGLFTMFDTRPTPIPTDGFIPANVAMLEAGRLDLNALWTESKKIITATMPELQPQIDMTLGMVRQMAGIDFEMDLMANLGSTYVSFGNVVDGEFVSVFVLDLKDGQALKQALETALTAPNIQPQIDMVLETVDFIDQTLYVSKSTVDPSEAFAFAIVGDRLLYGSPPAIRQVIRDLNSGTASQSRIANSELVKGLRQHIPGSAFGFTAIDWQKCMIFLIRELSDESIAQLVMQEWATSGAPIPPPDFSKLPSAEHLGSFFNSSYMYVEKTAEGLHQKIILKN